MKNTLKLGIFVLFLLCLSGIALAVAPSITVNIPAASGIMNGTAYNVSVTISNGTEVIDIRYCNLSTTSDGFFKSRLISSNATAGGITWQNKTDTTALTESASTTLSVQCMNVSGTLINGSRSGVTIDNSVPTCSMTIDRSQISPSNAISADGSASTDTYTSITYAWTLTEPNAATATSTLTTPLFGGENFQQSGSYTLALTVTDSAGHSTSCTSRTIDVQGGTVTVTLPGTTTATTPSGENVIVTESKNKSLLLVAIIACLAVAVILIAIIVVIQAKKPKKRRRR